MSHWTKTETRTDRWQTPRWLRDKLDGEFGPFDLDPCADEDCACAPRFFASDGLDQVWDAERIYVNPPYGHGVGRWVKKAFEAAQRGALVVMCCCSPAAGLSPSKPSVSAASPLTTALCASTSSPASMTACNRVCRPRSSTTSTSSPSS